VPAVFLLLLFVYCVQAEKNVHCPLYFLLSLFVYCVQAQKNAQCPLLHHCAVIVRDSYALKAIKGV
jgi:hypothetical protein